MHKIQKSRMFKAKFGKPTCAQGIGKQEFLNAYRQEDQSGTQRNRSSASDQRPVWVLVMIYGCLVNTWLVKGGESGTLITLNSCFTARWQLLHALVSDTKALLNAGRLPEFTVTLTLSNAGRIIGRDATSGLSEQYFTTSSRVSLISPTSKSASFQFPAVPANQSLA
jgi:hypothetical protein